MTEHAVLDRIPFRGAGRLVADLKGQARLVGQPLQLDLPQPQARPVRPAAVGGDHDFAESRVALAAHLPEPQPGGIDGERRGVVVDAEADIAFVGADVLDAIRHHLAKLLVLEVMRIDLDRLAFRSVVAAGVLEVTAQLFLLRIDGDHRLLDGLELPRLGVDVLELGIAIRMAAAVLGLAVDVAAVAQRLQQLGKARGADLVIHRAQRRRQLVVALRDPPQRPHRIAPRRRLQQRLQVRKQRWILGGQLAPTSAGPAHPAAHRDRISQVLEAAPDGAARDAGGARRRRHAARPGAVRLRGHIQSPRSLIKRRTNGFEPQRNGFLVDHPTTLSGSCRGENRPTPQGSGRRTYFWASPNPNEAPLRLLLLERHADRDVGWWADLIRPGGLSGRGPDELASPAEPIPLPPLDSPADRPALLRQVVGLAAEFAGKAVADISPEGADAD